MAFIALLVIFMMLVGSGVPIVAVILITTAISAGTAAINSWARKHTETWRNED